MRFQKALPIAALALLLTAGVALGGQDGTGGPEMATPNPEGCDRELITNEVFELFEQPSGGIFSGSIDSVNLADIAAREVADAETTQAIDETLRAYGACISKFGPIGAYAFLDPELSLVEMIYLGVSGATLDEATPLSEDEASLIVVARDLTPETIVELDDGQIGAVLPAPQPGTDFALLTFEQIDGLWMIVAVNPVLDEGDAPSGGGGP